MEYASEMVVQATLHKLRMIEVATTLSPDVLRPPHLRSWRDGWRHLKFLMMYSPNPDILASGSDSISYRTDDDGYHWGRANKNREC